MAKTTRTPTALTTSKTTPAMSTTTRTSGTTTTRLMRTKSGTAITAATTTDTSVGRTQLLQAGAAVLVSQPSMIGKGRTRVIFNRDREGNIVSITTVTGLQSTTVTPAGRVVGRALGTNEHQTVVDESFERVGTVVPNGDRIQLWLNDAVDAGYSQKVGSVVNHYTMLGEFCGYSTMEANDNAVEPMSLAA